MFLGGWGLFTSEFVGGGGSIVPLGHRSFTPTKRGSGVGKSFEGGGGVVSTR